MHSAHRIQNGLYASTKHSIQRLPGLAAIQLDGAPARAPRLTHYWAETGSRGAQIPDTRGTTQSCGARELLPMDLGRDRASSFVGVGHVMQPWHFGKSKQANN